MAPKAFVKILLDDTGELIGVEKDDQFFAAQEIPDRHKVPKKVKENWDLKILKIWHNSPCCVQLGGKQVCWPPCI